jgi:mRNA interferase RelE/StbE
MSYHVRFSEIAERDLDQMDPPVREYIIRWIRKNLEGIDNPRRIGKALQGDLSGLWRYRVGKYRIIVEIQDDDLIIMTLHIRFRKNAYR